MGLIRCEWCEVDDLYRDYHDNEWGIAGKSDNELFELLCLESFQAGLSWHIILKRRNTLNAAFNGFDPNIVAMYDNSDIDRIIKSEGVIKNRAKIEACIFNARAFLKIQKQYGTFSKYLFSFTDGRQIINRYDNLKDMPSFSDLSQKLSKDMKKHGFKFFGRVIAYSFLQASGVLNEHMSYCFKAKK